MSFLDRLISLPAKLGRDSSSPETRPVQMSLEERMALRREMMFDVVRTTMQVRGVPPSSYRVKVVPADKRAHSFVVMVDLPEDFLDSDDGSPVELRRLAAVMVEAARLRFSLLVVGVYWRVNERLRLPQGHAARDVARKAVDSGINSSDFGEHEPPDTAPQGLGPASPAEIAEFERALREGGVAQLDHRVYDSDVAPLTGGDPGRS